MGHFVNLVLSSSDELCFGTLFYAFRRSCFSYLYNMNSIVTCTHVL